MFILERAGTVKNYKYRVGDKISVLSRRGDVVVSGPICRINDSSIIVNYFYEVGINDIKAVYSPRYFIRILSKVCLIAGIGYFALDGFNSAINNENEIISNSTLITSGVLVGSGLAMKQFITRKFTLDKKWRVKILDLSF